MQFLHEDDSVQALAAAVRRPVRGPVNVAGDGTVSLTFVLRRLRKVAVPIPHPLFGTLVGAAGRARGFAISEDTARYVRFGRGVDLRRMHEELRFEPRYTTPEVIERLAGDLRGREAA